MSAMHILRQLRTAAAATLLLAGAAHAASDCKGADTAQWTADTAVEALICLERVEKLLDLSDCGTAKVCTRLNSWRSLPTQQQVAGASPLVSTVRDELAAQVDTEGFTEGRGPLRQVDAFLKNLRDVTPAHLAPTGGPLPTGAASKWSYDPAGKVLAQQEGELDVAVLLGIECSKAATAMACTRALRGSAQVLLAVLQLNRITHVFLTQKRNAFAEHVVELDERWKTYFARSRSQYPWELALNSWAFTKSRPARGLVGPPSEQWTLLHPTVGLRHRNGAESAYSSALVLEVLGYQRWTWDGSTMAGLRGGSLIAAWTEQSKRNKPAIGLMWHLPDSYSVGLMIDSTGTGRKTSLVLSADLAKLFTDPSGLKDGLLKR